MLVYRIVKQNSIPELGAHNMLLAVECAYLTMISMVAPRLNNELFTRRFA